MRMWSRKLIDGLVLTFGMFLFIAVPFFIIGTALSSRTAMVDTTTASETRTVLTDSMDPTLPVGSKVSVNKSETPKIGDMIQFRCTSESKCGKPRELPTIHRWVSTDPDGCMRIIGDNPKIDWSNEICFYPNEISIEGVVHKLPF